MTTASYCLIVSLKCEQNDYEKSAIFDPLSLFLYLLISAGDGDTFR